MSPLRRRSRRDPATRPEPGAQEERRQAQLAQDREAREQRRDATTICTTCWRLRCTTAHSQPRNRDLCDCQDWDEGVPAESQLVCQLCDVCGLQTVDGHTRYRFYQCFDCRPRVVDLDRRVGRLVIPISCHSLVNGQVVRSAATAEVTWSAGPDIDDEVLVAFAEELETAFSRTVWLGERRDRLVAARCAELGLLEGAPEVVPLRQYQRRCAEAGLTPEGEWQKLIEEGGTGGSP
jgi:hypothetical protein